MHSIVSKSTTGIKWKQLYSLLEYIKRVRKGKVI